MGFKKGDRVVTNQNAFSASPDAPRFQGKKGTVAGPGISFDYVVLMDDKSVADGEWFVNTNEIDAVSDES